jgi:hypothetical protein
MRGRAPETGRALRLGRRCWRPWKTTPAIALGLALVHAPGLTSGPVAAQSTSEMWRSPLPSLRPGSITYVPVRVLPALTPATTPAATSAPVRNATSAPATTTPHTDTALASAPASGLTRTPRPVLRQNTPLSAAQNTAQSTAQSTNRGASPRPPAPRYSLPASTGPAGRLCNSRAIRGQQLPDIAAALPGCGLKDGVRVVSVSGVALSPPATLSCRSAKALNTWVTSSVIPTLGRLGGGAAELRIASSYACRSRNNQPGAKISEHGKGSAIDISAITLKNGVTLDVLSGWKDPLQGKLLKALHQGACEPFGTVLGPDADRFHRDHFHFDTARNQGGSYCR